MSAYRIRIGYWIFDLVGSRSRRRWPIVDVSTAKKTNSKIEWWDPSHDTNCLCLEYFWWQGTTALSLLLHHQRWRFRPLLKKCKWNKSSAVADMGDRLATSDMGRKVGGGCCAPFGVEELGPHLTQCGLGRAETYLHTKWCPDPSNCLVTIDMGRGLYGRTQSLSP